jgi:hypothetical protein
VIRPFRAGDRNFVVNSWLRSFQSSGRAGSWASTDEYRAHYEPLVIALLERGRVDVMVDDHDDDQIFGYACTRGARLEYVYVKKLFRAKYSPRLRCAATLLAAADVRPDGRRFVVGFWTPVWGAFATKHGYVYDHRPDGVAVDGEERA